MVDRPFSPTPGILVKKVSELKNPKLKRRISGIFIFNSLKFENHWFKDRQAMRIRVEHEYQIKRINPEIS